MGSSFITWIHGLVWDVLAFRGHWLLFLLLVLTLTGFWWWRRASSDSKRWLAWSGHVALAAFALLVIAGLRVVWEPSFAKYAKELRRAHGYVGLPVPELRFSRVDNDEPLRLSDLRGNVVLLNLWATWCPPCVDEMPDLERLQASYRDQGLLVVTLSNESRQHLLAFLEAYPVDTLNVYQESFGWIYDTEARPMNFLIDRNGALLDCTEMPGEGDYAAFANWVDEHLGT